MKSIKIVLILIVLSIINVFGTIRYVSKTGSSTPPYTSWETASDLVQKCMDICNFGDTIYMGKGNYNQLVIMKPGTSLIGIDRDSCIFDTRLRTNIHTTIHINDSCLVENLTILQPNIYEKPSYGIYSWQRTNAIIKNCNMYNCVHGIGLARSYNTVIEGNHLSNSIRTCIELDGNSYSYNCLIKNNLILNDLGSGRCVSAAYPYSGIFDENILIITSNGFNSALYTFEASNSIFRNNLIILKSAKSVYGIVAAYNNQTLNNLVMGRCFDGSIRLITGTINNNSIIESLLGITITLGAVQYNNLYEVINPDSQFTLDSTNTFHNPMIVNDDKNNFDGHLQKYSPLIDAGDPTILDVDGSRSDIGLYGGPYGESYTYIDYAPHIPHNLSSTIVKKNITINWNMNTEADFSHYEVYLDTVENFTPDSTRLIAIVDTNNYNGVRSFEKSTYYRILAVDNQGNKSVLSEPVSVIVTGVDEPIVKEMDYMLYNAYPNPFNPSTTIAYRLKEDGYVKLSVYDIKGELVEILVNEVLPKGYYQASFSPKNTGKDLASGIYIYRIDIRNSNNIPVYSDMKKMILMK
ncbi:MAG TPA: right-handed parallel beta-helix repeat-containing protein [Ignavibacteriaceae bacterium]|nr:right-handed parallel beta-helix repeat-containing protein [Ignavibacteriaceae bacterium]